MSFTKILNKYREISFSEHDKGNRFERLMQAWLRTDPKYAFRFKNVWLWNEKYRQVIIVTHNANLVVNADAEQVILAANENETLNYNSGGIENVAIRDQICNILEGGKDAFTKREQKYGFVII